MATRKKLLLVSAALTLLAMGLILTDWSPVLRGPAPGTGEWYWPYQLRTPGRWWAPLAAAAFLWLVSVLAIGRRETRRAGVAVFLLALFLGNVLLQIAVVYSDRPDVLAELVDRTYSNLSGGYFEPAVLVDDLGDVLRTYPTQMPAFTSEHAQTHPPGLLLINWSAVQLFSRMPSAAEPLAALVWSRRCIDLWLLERPAAVAAGLLTMSLLPVVAGGLTVIAAFFLGRRWYRERGAWLAAALVASLPALVLFTPKVDQLFALLGVLTLLCADLALSRSSRIWSLFSGLCLSLASFLSIGNAALVVPVLFLFSLRSKHRSRQWPFRERLNLLVPFVLGVMSLWLLYWLLSGVAPWRVAAVAMSRHYQLVTLHRRYSWWLAYNFVDLLLYAGIVIVVGVFAAALGAWKNRGGKGIERNQLVAFGLVALLLLLDVSGSTRAEVGRIWLFFMPLLAISAAGFWNRMSMRRPLALVIALQLLLTVSLGVAWRPVRAVAVVATPPAETAEPVTVPLAVPFGKEIILEGYALPRRSFAAGEPVDVTLVWRALGAARRPYTVFTHVVGEDGRLVAQQDNWPVRGTWPPTCWQAGALIVDPYRIVLPEGLEPGDYVLSVGMYDAARRERLLTGSGHDAVSLGTISVR
jgi:hypothetical protein